MVILGSAAGPGSGSGLRDQSWSGAGSRLALLRPWSGSRSRLGLWSRRVSGAWTRSRPRSLSGMGAWTRSRSSYIPARG